MEESSDNIFELKAKMNSLGAALSSIQRGTKALLALDGDDEALSPAEKRKALNPEERRLRSKSAWARSTLSSDRNVVGTKRLLGSSDVVDPMKVTKADGLRRKRSPAYSFGYKRPMSTEQSEYTDTPGPSAYDVKDYQLSTTSRTKGGKLPTARRDAQKMEIDGQDPCSHADTAADPETNSEVVVTYEEVTAAGGHSFGRQRRFKEPMAATAATGSEHADTLDIVKATDSLRPHIPTAVMMKPSAVKANDEPAAGSLPADSAGQVVSKLDNLSTHYRSPAPTMYSTPSPAVNKALIRGDIEHIPGPGHYMVSHRALTATKKGYGVATGTAIHNSRAQIVVDRPATADNAELGPGCYPTAGRGVLSTQRSVRATTLYQSSDKTNPHLERKRYLEQKAQDMREFHDFQHDVDDMVLRKRVPAATLRSASNPRASRESQSKDSKSRLIMDIDRAIGAQDVEYEVKYALTERRSSTGVSMKAEIQARSSTQGRLAKRPGVAERIIEKQQGDRVNRMFYGPSLPVQWVNDKEVMRYRYADAKGDDSDGDAPPSPTREILKLLGEASPGGEDNQEYTEAFLKSSYGGALHRKPAHDMSTSKKPVKRDTWIDYGSDEDAGREFIGSQLQDDWTSDGGRVRKTGFDIGATPGREQVRIPSKGVKMTKSFTVNDPMVFEEEDGRAQVMGPGMYDVMTGTNIASAPVKGVPFSKATAREGDPDPDEQRDGQVLDIDYGRAKDMLQGRHQNRGPQLYVNDRYEAQDDDIEQPNRDHLGGSWFEGDFDKVAKNKKSMGAVDFSKMTSRPVGPVKEQDPELDGAGELDLQVADWRPHKSNTDGRVQAFGDPSKNPRFKETINEDVGQLDLDVAGAKDRLKNKSVPAVDMTKMRGRVSVDGPVIDEVHGDIDKELAVKLAQETELALQQGEDATKKRRAVGQVDFNKQVARTDAQRDREETRQMDGEGSQTLYADAPAVKERNPYDGKGAQDWKVLRGRENSNPIGRTVVNVDGEREHDEELDLDPKTTASSKYRSVPQARDWEKAGGRGKAEVHVGPSGSIATGAEVDSNGRVLDLEDIDSGFSSSYLLQFAYDIVAGNFKKKGMQSLAQSQQQGRNMNMRNQTDRQPIAQLEGSLAIKEEVILEQVETGKDQRKARTPGVTSMRNTGDLDVTKGVNKNTLLTAEEQQYNTEVILDSKKVHPDTFNMAKNDNVRAVNNKNKGILKGADLKDNLRLSVQEQRALNELNKDQDELLIVEPRRLAIGTDKAPGYSSMKDQAERKSQTKDRLVLNEDGNLQREDEVIVNPTDKALQKASKGATMKSQSTRFTNRNEERTVQAIQREQPEVIINPDFEKGRTTPARALQSKEVRFPSAKDEQAEKELRKSADLVGADGDRLLDLDPKTQVTATRVKSASSLGNKESRLTSSSKSITRDGSANRPPPTSRPATPTTGTKPKPTTDAGGNNGKKTVTSTAQTKTQPQGSTKKPAVVQPGSADSPYATPTVSKAATSFPARPPPGTKAGGSKSKAEPTSEELMKDVDDKLKALGLA